MASLNGLSSEKEGNTRDALKITEFREPDPNIKLEKKNQTLLNLELKSSDSDLFFFPMSFLSTQQQWQ